MIVISKVHKQTDPTRACIQTTSRDVERAKVSSYIHSDPILLVNAYNQHDVSTSENFKQINRVRLNS